MRVIFIAIVAVFLLGDANGAPSTHEVWRLKLTGEGGVYNFERPLNRIWARQQGIVFLSPTRLAIYQVNRTTKPAPLAGRSASGGAGNFFLLVRVFDSHSGQEIKRMQFLTAADFSAILPTHDGKFIVRAGDLVLLYSPDFELLQSRQLAMTKTAPLEYWEVKITPSGKQVVLVHQQRFVNPLAPPEVRQSEENSQTDVEVLDSDAFATVRALHLPYYLPVWSADDRFLLATEPGKPLDNGQFGTMDFQGHWAALHPAWERNDPCPYDIDLLDNDLMSARGCGLLVVFAESGERLLTLSEYSESFGPVASADHYFAVEFLKPEGSSKITALQRIRATRIKVYDLKSGELTIPVRLENDSASYALSPQGLLAVVDGDVLKVYQPSP